MNNALLMMIKCKGMTWRILLIFFVSGVLPACLENKTWQAPQLVWSDDGETQVSEPKVAMDINGNGFAAWSLWDRKSGHVIVRRYSKKNGWESQKSIELEHKPPIGPVQIAMDPYGNALVVWAQGDGLKINIWSNRYTPAEGWATAQMIETNDGQYVDGLQVAMDHKGKGLAVWSQSEIEAGHLYTYSIWANRFTPTGGWEKAQQIENEPNEAAISPRLAMNLNGSALVVWEQYDFNRHSVGANRFTPTLGWGMSQRIETEVAQQVWQSPQIAMDPKGNGIAIWSRSNKIWTNHYTSAGGWGSASPLNTFDAEVLLIGPLKISMDPLGNGMAVWSQGTKPDLLSKIWTDHYTPDGGWETPQMLVSDDTKHSIVGLLVTDFFGDAMVMWIQEAFGPPVRVSISANLYTKEEGWNPEQMLIADYKNYNNVPPILDVASDYMDNAVMVWRQTIDGNTHIWSSAFR